MDNKDVKEEIDSHKYDKSNYLTRRFALATMRVVYPLSIDQKEDDITGDSRHYKTDWVWDT